MELRLVKAEDLRKYAKFIKSSKDGKKTIYLEEGVHTTIHPIKDRQNSKLNEFFKLIKLCHIQK